jgi:hypothetical protein
MEHIKLFEEFRPLEVSNNIIDRLKKSFDLSKWNTPEAKEKRKKLTKEAWDIYVKITDIANSTIEDSEKASKIQSILKGTTIITGIAAIISLFFGSDISFTLQAPFIHGLKGGFLLKITIFLKIIETIHYVLSSGEAIKSVIKKIWNSISPKSKKLNESVYSKSEYIEIVSNIVW